MPFDILAYLNLYPDPKIKPVLSNKLLDYLLQFITLKTIESLPSKKVAESKNLESLFDLAQEEIPDYNSKIRRWVIEFKKEYESQLGRI